MTGGEEEEKKTVISCSIRNQSGNQSPPPQCKQLKQGGGFGSIVFPFSGGKREEEV